MEIAGHRSFDIRQFTLRDICLLVAAVKRLDVAVIKYWRRINKPAALASVDLIVPTVGIEAVEPMFARAQGT